jgi:predicted O-methyltransferase YrrM
VDIELSRANNILALRGLSVWLGLDKDALNAHYDELINNKSFLHEISCQLEKNVNFKVNPPDLFKRAPITNPDWFGLQRILLYCIVREKKPHLVLETGVYYGGNSAFILEALEANNQGQLIGIDLPQHSMISSQQINRHPWVGESELYNRELQPGFIVPQYLSYRFDLRLGDSIQEIENISHPIDFFVHDSEHTYAHLENELSASMKLLTTDGLILVDDVDWSNAFYDFIVRKNLYPYFLPDNAKDDLRFRTGIVKLDHKNNNLNAITSR